MKIQWYENMLTMMDCDYEYTPEIKNQIKNLLTSSSELITLGSLLSNEYTPKNF